jgi:predicted acylesterase/phospholipase RssA
MLAELAAYHAVRAHPIKIVSGTSVGALNAAALAQFTAEAPTREVAAAQLLALWASIKPEDVYNRGRFGLLSMAWRLVRSRPLYDSSPLQQLVRDTLSRRGLANSPLQLFVHATDLVGRRQVTATNDDPHILEAVMASAALPGAFPHVDIEGRPFVDGGVVANTPIRAAIDAGATKLTIIYLDNERIARRTSLPEALGSSAPHDASLSWVLSRSIEAAMAAHLERDLHMLRLYNDLVIDGHRPDKRVIEYRLLHPTSPLGPPQSTLDFRPETIHKFLSRGQRDGRRAARQIDFSS